MPHVHIGVLEGRLTPSEGRGIQFFPYRNWEKEFATAQHIGFDCIELLIQRKDWGNDDHPLLSPEGISRIRQIAVNTGISMPSIHAYYEPRETYALELETIARAAEELRISVVLLSFFKHSTLNSQSAKETARAYMEKALARLQNNNVRFGLEAELPAEELLHFIATLSVPERFGVYYDLGNQYARGFPVIKEIGTLGDRILGVHIKDRLPQTTNENESPSVPLGKGCVNFPEAFAALKEAGYAGSFIIQGARQEGRDDVEVVMEYYDFVKRLTAQS